MQVQDGNPEAPEGQFTCVEQVAPVNPLVHPHVYDPAVFVHTPPLRQGLERHSLASTQAPAHFSVVESHRRGSVVEFV